MPPLSVDQLNALKCLMFGIMSRDPDTSFTRHLTSLTLLELEIRLRYVKRVIRQVSVHVLLLRAGSK